MNFRQATDELIAGVTLEDLARGLGISVQAVRQARAAEGTTAHRKPPEGWAEAASKLASMRARKLDRLAAKLQETP